MCDCSSKKGVCTHNMHITALHFICEVLRTSIDWNKRKGKVCEVKSRFEINDLFFFSFLLYIIFFRRYVLAYELQI